MSKSKVEENAGLDLPAIQLSKRRRSLCFIIIYFLFMLDIITRSGINVIFPFIQTDLGLTDAQVGIMGTVLSLTMAVCVLPFSFLGEKYSSKKAITLCASVWTIGGAIAGKVTSFGALLGARFGQGLGSASFSSLSNGMVTSMYPKSKWGNKIGILNTAQTLAVAFASILFGTISKNMGWRTAFFILAGMSLVGALLSLLLPDPKKANGNETTEEKAAEKKKISFGNAVKTIFTNPALVCVSIAGGISNMLILAILAWASFFFMREMGLSVGTNSILMTVIALVSAVGFLLGGILVDKWYKRDKRGRVFLPAISLTAAMFFLVAGFKLFQPILIMLGATCVTIALTTFHVTVQELVPSWFKSFSYGFITLCMQGIGAIGPVLTGTLSDKVGLPNALAIVTCALVVSVVLLLIASRLYIKAYDKARAQEAE